MRIARFAHFQLAAAILSAPAALGQASTWVVDDTGGPGVDFTALSAAIAAAQDGDTLLVRTGRYGFSGSHVIDGKGLRIVVDAGHGMELLNTLTVQNLAAGQELLLRGMRISPGSPTSATNQALILRQNQGRVWIEDCSFSGAASLTPVVAPAAVAIEDCASVSFARTRVHAAPVQGSTDVAHDALAVLGSSVSLHDCTLVGMGGNGADIGPCCFDGGGGGAGARVAQGSFLHAAGTSFVGGDGGTGSGGTSACVAGAGGSGGDGGSALVVDGGSQAWVLDSTFSHGFGGGPGGPACPAGQSGAAQLVQGGSTLTSLAGVARSYRTTTPVREGQAFTATYEAPAGEFAFLDVSTSQGFLFLSAFSGVLLPGGAVQTFFSGVVPAAGVLQTTSTIQELGPGVASAVLYEQAVFFNLSQGIWIAAPSAVVMLDAAL